MPASYPHLSSCQHELPLSDLIIIWLHVLGMPIVKRSKTSPLYGRLEECSDPIRASAAALFERPSSYQRHRCSAKRGGHSWAVAVGDAFLASIGYTASASPLGISASPRARAGGSRAPSTTGYSETSALTWASTDAIVEREDDAVRNDDGSEDDGSITGVVGIRQHAPILGAQAT